MAKIHLTEEEAAKLGLGANAPAPIVRDWWFQVTLTYAQRPNDSKVYAVPHVPGFLERYAALLLAPEFVSLTVATSDGKATVERTTPV